MDQRIVFPVRLSPRAPPIFNDDNIARTPDDHVKTVADLEELVADPPDGRARSRLEGLEVARLIIIRHGCIPDYLKSTVSGPTTTQKERDNWNKPNSGYFASIVKQVSQPRVRSPRKMY